MSRKPALLALVLGLLAAACGRPPEPELELGSGRTFVPVVVDAVSDVGRFPSVAVDAQGQPVVVAFAFEEATGPGQLPETRPLDAPTVPAVVIDARRDGSWVRGGVAMAADAPVAVPFGPETVEALSSMAPGNVNGTDVAVDGNGGLHVAWVADTGVWYASGDGTSFSVERVRELRPPLQRAGALGPPALAVDEAGEPVVAFVDASGGRAEVTLAARAAEGWEAEVVSTAAGGSAAPTGVAFQDGEPVVAFLDGGTPTVARRAAGGAWGTEPIEVGVDAAALSFAGGPDGGLYAAYVAGGEVRVAAPGGGGWRTSTVAAASGTTSRTGVAVDGQGTVWVTWDDGRGVHLASGGTDGFEEVETHGAAGGASPDVAVASDGSAAFVAWYDPAHGDLLLGAYEDVEGLALARPTGLASPAPPPTVPPPTSPPPTSPSPQPTGSPTGGPPPGECPPNGVRITASVGAISNGFDQTELTVPAGEPFTVCFDNKDTGIPHNWALYTDGSASEQLAQAGNFPNDPPAPALLVAEVPALDPGEYFFRCDYHPTTMTGTLTAE